MKLEELKYDIGDWVKVNSFQKRHRGIKHQEVTWKPVDYKEARIGRVVGLCKRCEGVVKNPPYDVNYFGEEDYAPAYMEVSKTHTFYEVRLGWLNKPILVAESDIRLCSVKEIIDIPMLHINWGSCWSERSRQFQREEMKDWPRDSQGRWIKEQLTEGKC